MGTHKATLEEDAGIQRTNPRHRRSTRQRRANGVVPSPNQTLRAGGADYMAGRMGSPKGKLGSVSPFFSFISVFSVPLCYTETHPYSCFSALARSLSLSHMYNYCFPLSGFHHSPSPTPYLLWDLWRRQPCPTRDAKNGDTTSGQRTWATPLCLPPPAHPDGFITSYAAHFKPIESLGGRECLTQISTSEGVSATLGNC